MQLVRLARRAIKATIPPALFLSLASYFGWNAMHGAHGMQAYQQQLGLRAQALQAQVDASSERQVWTRRVEGLRERAMDGDMLDERSRAMLNLAKTGDIVIPYGQHDKLY